MMKNITTKHKEPTTNGVRTHRLLVSRQSSLSRCKTWDKDLLLLKSTRTSLGTTLENTKEISNRETAWK